ncbi:hypothetical protein [Maridesulfovibrio ferrireducens]|uniref:phage tail tip fiber protein n=1 Tax=Maridesulfovibrio ferrireducens TaxID=246191 RepID=UPI001A3313C5|nr:hypothetical protein [Maridesulfovibrio ferrireducens]MBI9113143.1 DUF1983 domain-containing protein [Maridesulfovibrio ferrireducens]
MATKGARSPNIPNVPAGLDKSTRDFLSALKETLETMQGKRRNSFSDSVVTFNDLQNLGFKVSQKVGTDADYDFSRSVRSGNPPNPPRDLKVDQQIFANKLTWVNPSDADLSHIEVWCSVGSSSLSDASRIGIATKPVVEFTHSGLNTRTDHYYWIRAIDWSNNYSIWEPRQGGFLAPASLGVALEEALHVLQDSITESQLYGDLNSRIDLIDGPDTLAGSVAAKVKLEKLERVDADSALAQQVQTVQASADGNVAAIQIEATARVDADSALAQQVQTVQASADGNVAAIQIEATARVDADSALAAEYFIKTDVNGHIAGFGVHNDGATSEAIFLVDKFAVVTPGSVPKVPFVVGEIDGNPTVGIDGDMIVDGSIAARMMDANIITGAFLSASAQIALGLNGLLRLEEGAKIFAGAGNFLLNTSGNETTIIMGDDGTVDAAGNIAPG